MKLRPVNDKIVVKQINKEDEHITESGLILPDSAQDGGLFEGEVIAVSEGMYSINGTQIPFVVKKGDKILYGKHNGGQEYKFNNEEVVIMSQNEVLSIVEDK